MDTRAELMSDHEETGISGMRMGKEGTSHEFGAVGSTHASKGPESWSRTLTMALRAAGLLKGFIVQVGLI